MRGTLVLSIVATAMSHQLGAQEPTPGRLQAVLPCPGVRLSAVSPRMHGGAVVRVGIVGGPRISGRYVGIVGDTMLLSATAAATRVGVVVFDSLWTRHRPIVSNAIRGCTARRIGGWCLQAGAHRPGFVRLFLHLVLLSLA